MGHKQLNLWPLHWELMWWQDPYKSQIHTSVNRTLQFESIQVRWQLTSERNVKLCRPFLGLAKRRKLFFCWQLLRCPGRSALQSAEQRCQKRYGHKHQMMWYIIKTWSKNMQKGHTSSNKTIRNIQKPESTKGTRRGLCEISKESTYARVGRASRHECADRGFGGILKESTYARAWSTQLRKKSRNIWMDIIEQKESVQKVCSHCGKPRRNINWSIICEVNPQAKCSSESVKLGKRETLQPPQLPLNISWLGEAKTA